MDQPNKQSLVSGAPVEPLTDEQVQAVIAAAEEAAKMEGISERGPANSRQVGGSHYKTGGEEHWDRVARLGLDYFQGQITKYVERWKKKGGLADLEKARHFLDKYIEVETARAKEGSTASSASAPSAVATGKNKIVTKPVQIHYYCGAGGQLDGKAACGIGTIEYGAKGHHFTTVWDNVTCVYCRTVRNVERAGAKKAEAAPPAQPDPSHTWGPLTPAGQGRCVVCGAYRHLGSGFMLCPGPRKGIRPEDTHYVTASGKVPCSVNPPSYMKSSHVSGVTCPDCKKWIEEAAKENIPENLPPSNEAGGDRPTTPAAEPTEPCCECGEEYPSADLRGPEGHVYCPRCRVLPHNQPEEKK